MRNPILTTVPDIMEWFIHKERMPEYFELSDELIDDFESYGIGVRGYDRFIDYFYILLPEHNKELFDKHKDAFKRIHQRRIFSQYNLTKNEQDHFDIEDRVADTTRDIDNDPIDSSLYYFTDTAYMLKKWHRYKQVYRFHKSLADRLAETNLNGFYPGVLDDLPFKTFYIDMSDFKIPADLQMVYKDHQPDGSNIFLGALVNIIKDTNAKKDGKNITQYIMHMILFSQPNRFSWTRFVYYADMEKRPLKEGFPKGSLMSELGDWIPSFLVNAVIYIASNNNDITPTVKRKVKRNPKLNPRKMILENSIKDWSAGYVIGPKIEKAMRDYEEEYEITGTHNSPRPHVRGAHWHHYWVGPKDGDRHLILRWIDETLVNCDDNEKLPTTERRSKK